MEAGLREGTRTLSGRKWAEKGCGEGQEEADFLAVVIHLVIQQVVSGLPGRLPGRGVMD